jgi:hypothetical protein
MATRAIVDSPAVLACPERIQALATARETTIVLMIQKLGIYRRGASNFAEKAKYFVLFCLPCDFDEIAPTLLSRLHRKILDTQDRQASNRMIGLQRRPHFLRPGPGRRGAARGERDHLVHRVEAGAVRAPWFGLQSLHGRARDAPVRRRQDPWPLPCSLC